MNTINKTQIRKTITAKVGGSFLSFGNSKLPKEHMILNLSSARCCPSKALGMCHCADTCYALKCERIYKSYAVKSERIQKWLSGANEDEIFETLAQWAQTNTVKTTHLRLNESGDFHTQDEVNMWSRLSERFEKIGITVYAWSARKDLDFSKVHFAVQGSDLSQLDKMGRVYYCVDSARFDELHRLYTETPDEHVGFCQCSFGKEKTCKGCGLCSTKDFRGIIYTRMH